jgi:AmmeMemoRadiSam system protein B
VCGFFYPSDPPVLRQDVASLLDHVQSKSVRGRIRGIISPHAGYIYSGFTAANAFALLRNSRYETVVIVSPSHRDAFEGISVFPGGGYRTPLGTVMVNERLRSKLLDACNVVHASEAGHGSEHAIEVQLPFLQHVLPEFSLLPLVIGVQDRKTCFALGEAMGSVFAKEDLLLVASTDLSHYYPYERANALDEVVCDDIRRFDYEQLMADLESGRAEACGGGPTVAVMVALSRMGVENMEVLYHCNSGDVTGDRHKVVGYLSAVAYA